MYINNNFKNTFFFRSVVCSSSPTDTDLKKKRPTSLKLPPSSPVKINNTVSNTLILKRVTNFY